MKFTIIFNIVVGILSSYYFYNGANAIFTNVSVGGLLTGFFKSGENIFEWKEANFNNNQPFLKDLDQIEPEYDYIIVGAGPAGCVLANRLTERSDVRVLLIEAGAAENMLHQIPIMAAFFQSTSSNWNYQSEPENDACLGMKNNQCALPRGRVLGGSSVINYMIYNRGNRRDFDRWAEAGNAGWSYKDVLPYFLKSERSSLRGQDNSPYHNKSGLLNVEDVPYRSIMADAFVTASKQAGLPQVDYNGKSQIGVSYVQATTDFGRRHSAAMAYLEPIRNRKNLHVLINTRVTKILIDLNTKMALGVEYMTVKGKRNALARKEVILSAGTFNSPQLLMLSGVGPSQQLATHGIPVIKELPVGQIMYDHLSHFGPTFILNTTGNSLKTRNLGIPEIQQFINGGGVLTSIGGVEALAFVKTKNSKEPADLPDIELIFVAGSLASDEGTGLKEGANFRDDLYDQLYKPLEQFPNDHFTILPMLFHPKSFGKVELKNNNPFQSPRITANYLKHEDDIETLINGIKSAIKISQSPAMKQLGVRLYDTPVPGCERIPFASDDYWRCSVRTMSYTLHHQVGTCKMGPATDPTAVVSPELKVHGIHRLRVVDTSIIPQPTTSHVNAASYMIGEKASDLIKLTW